MRIGCFSDVHGNVEALEIALRVLERAGVDEVYFLGDATGYLPGTAALTRIVSLAIPAIRGNHDEMLLDSDGLGQRDEIYRLRETRAQLTGDLAAAVRSWPIRRHLDSASGNCLLVHGSPIDPLNGYVYPDANLAEVPADGYSYVVMGHTHRPFIRSSGGTTFINAGSVGLPRDCGTLGSVALVDTASGEAEILRFDIQDASRRALARCGDVAPPVRAVMERVAPVNLEGRIVG